jgi:zinc transporter 7
MINLLDVYELFFLLGSLLGDVFLHLLPHAFSSHAHDGHSNEKEHAHGSDEHRNVLIGIGIFAGLFFFYAADKFARAFFGKTGRDHSHDHAHHQHEHVEQVVDQVAVHESKEGLRHRNSKSASKTDEKKKIVTEKKHVHDDANVRASTYLSLLADFTHNLTDGIAMAASFYASPAVGATTAVAVFFHEIPHEVSDYAILLQSGFSKQRAMMAQFTTAIGAYIGTFIGISIHEMAASLSNDDDSHHHHHHHHQHHDHHGLLGTGMTLGDLVIPATAGSFLYIATVGVIPNLLEGQPKNKLQPFKELSAMMFGMALMAGIAWTETHHH